MHSLIIRIFILAGLFFSAPAWAVFPESHFFSNDVNAAQIVSGTPYDMNDPTWVVSGRQNRNVFAYKVLSALFMLGYQTQQYAGGGDQVNTLKQFQSLNNLAVTNLLDATALALLDNQIAVREPQLATLAAGLPASLKNHMQTLNSNDVSPDTLAAIFSLPMSVLPPSLQLSDAESAQCVAGQCVGAILDSGGVNAAPLPLDLNSNYLFVGNYFDPLVPNQFLPSAPVLVNTLLHEYAHYLDGYLNGWVRSNPQIGWMYASQTHLGSIGNAGFYSIMFDMNSGINSCYTRKSNNPKDWISQYGFQTGYGNCPDGKTVPWEEWAEAFSMYVTAGRDFRAAAMQSNLISQQYNWLRLNVFNGLEYDTDLTQGNNSGCNDVPLLASQQPGYMHCNTRYVWDFTLPHALVNGSCGAANSATFVTAPASNLCASGIPSTVNNTGTWSWSCGGLNNGSSTICSANILTGNTPDAPGIVNVVGGNTQASITFTAPASSGDSAITGYTVTSNPPGGIDTNAGTTALIHTLTGLTNDTAYTFTVTAHNIFGDGSASGPSVVVIPSWQILVENFDGVSLPTLPANWLSAAGNGTGGAWRTCTASSPCTYVHNPAPVPHSGSNLVSLNSYALPAGRTALLATPAFSLAGLSGAKVSFWMYRDASNGSDYVEVWTNGSANLTGATLLGTVNRYKGASPVVSAAGWYQYVFNLPGSLATNYVIFNGVSGFGNDISIDDVSIAIPPATPTISAVSGSNGQATVTFTPPTSNGGSAITGYTVSSVPAGGVDATPGSTALTHTLTGLTNGVAYTFTVTANNVAGSGTPAISLNSVTPAGPPGAPAISNATASDASATVKFSAPSSDGGSPVTGYTVTSNPGNITASGPASPITVFGLTSGVAYTFTVTATNNAGTGVASNPSNSVIPITVTLPGAPTAVSALAGDTQIIVSFTAPADTGGGVISGYTVTCNPGGATATGSNTPIMVAGLANGTDYTCSVTATNSAGVSSASALAIPSPSGCGGTINGQVQGITAGNCTVSAETLQVHFPPVTSFLIPGWNLLGNSTDTPLDVGAALGDTSQVTSVWKWIPATGNWAFYAPSMGAGLDAYTKSKGYDVLAQIKGGEGFWVNAKTVFTLQFPAGNTIRTAYYQDQTDPTQNKLLKGWNLIATGDNQTPRQFNQDLSVILPAAGVTPLNVTTIWAWDSIVSNWYFYAPNLDASNGLVSYISNKGYLDFTEKSRTLYPASGFWVNKP